MSDLDIWGDPYGPIEHKCPTCDDEGEEVDPDAASSDTDSGQALDWAHGYGRGQ